PGPRPVGSGCIGRGRTLLIDVYIHACISCLQAMSTPATSRPVERTASITSTPGFTRTRPAWLSPGSATPPSLFHEHGVTAPPASHSLPATQRSTTCCTSGRAERLGRREGGAAQDLLVNKADKSSPRRAGQPHSPWYE